MHLLSPCLTTDQLYRLPVTRQISAHFEGRRFVRLEAVLLDWSSSTPVKMPRWTNERKDMCFVAVIHHSSDFVSPNKKRQSVHLKTKSNNSTEKSVVLLLTGNNSEFVPSLGIIITSLHSLFVFIASLSLQNVVLFYLKRYFLPLLSITFWTWHDWERGQQVNHHINFLGADV